MKQNRINRYMITTYYFKIPRRIRLLVLFLLVILLTYFIVRFLPLEIRKIPKEFLKARQEASLIAQEIVSLSDESRVKLDEIALLDRDRDYTNALVLVSKEIERNRDARERGIELAAQLEIMARNLAQISPASSGQRALEAVSSETALISRLITYNDYLTQLLEVLREKFLGRNNGDKVPELIGKINNEAQAINDLNRRFSETMKEFDSE